MKWIIPGTVLSMEKAQAAQIDQQFTAMFLGGGMVLSQISAITGLEAYTIQNWVKRGFLPAPEQKRYNMNQLCRITTINMLKNALPMEKITGLISHVNGELDDISDDIIDDAQLYFLFVGLAARIGEGYKPELWAKFVEEALADYAEPVPGAKKRVQDVLQIMLVAWTAANLQKKAEELLERL